MSFADTRTQDLVVLPQLGRSLYILGRRAKKCELFGMCRTAGRFAGGENHALGVAINVGNFPLAALDRLAATVARLPRFLIERSWKNDKRRRGQVRAPP